MLKVNACKPATHFYYNRFTILLLIVSCLLTGMPHVHAQEPEMIYKNNIKCVRLNVYGDQFSLPVLNLNSSDQLELDFDDLDANIKSYYYTFQLCDYNWKPVDLNPFMYLKGFTQQMITTNRYSSIAYTRYTHYQAMIPDKSTTITLSGNYMLKVYLNGDTSLLAFTRRVLVVDSKAAIAAKVVQPFAPQYFNTHQKIQFTANITGTNAFSAAQQVKAVILQNNRWDNALRDIAPTFVRGNSLEYSSENNCLFPAGKEWRWLDLRDFRLQSDRVDSAHYGKTATDVYVKPDHDRSAERYIYYRDLDGMFSIETYNNINPYWQGDFATVHFTFVTPDGKPMPGKDIYLAGQLTDYAFNDKTRMVFNAAKGVYEGTAFLKQGYYNYTYIAVDKNDPTQRTDLEGNYWETQNTYTILMYYKGFTDRSDQLIGVSRISSRVATAGVSF
ncbi:MAG: DUF5103 domain-containing protein [Bacteroidetes bacterium]|nr:DUF5103 domain-containing protein [Bacteroidota bacterium]